MNEIQTGDCFNVLADMEADTFHACVTDPPYGLAFMGRDWDDFEPREYQDWCEEWATEVKRVLKPGAHLLAFSGNRTHHRLFSGVEDAGFEIRDTLTWHYGSGFPKSLDVSKAIDKAAGAEREVVGVKPGHEEFAGRDTDGHRSGVHVAQGDHGREWHKKDDAEKYHKKTAPATDAAREWDGFKTCLKPATEFIVLARKSLGKSTVAENVLEYGTGALNVGECRIGDGNKYSEAPNPDMTAGSETGGRYPANVTFDETEAARLDREVGELDQGYHLGNSDPLDEKHLYGDNRTGGQPGGYDDGGGGPSRFFYTSKASRNERTENGQIENSHPTVKPVDLMEWLVRLVTKEGQTILDSFAGTGTTCKAAKGLGRNFVGIEQQAKWADVARARCGLTPEDPSRLRDDNQGGLETF